MAARKVQLKDYSGNKAYPVTSSACVGMSDGSGNLDEYIKELEGEIYPLFGAEKKGERISRATDIILSWIKKDYTYLIEVTDVVAGSGKIDITGFLRNSDSVGSQVFGLIHKDGVYTATVTANNNFEMVRFYDNNDNITSFNYSIKVVGVKSEIEQIKQYLKERANIERSCFLTTNTFNNGLYPKIEGQKITIPSQVVSYLGGTTNSNIFEFDYTNMTNYDVFVILYDIETREFGIKYIIDEEFKELDKNIYILGVFNKALTYVNINTPYININGEIKRNSNFDGIRGVSIVTTLSNTDYTLFRSLSQVPGVLNIKGNGDFDKNVEFYLKKTPSDSTFKSLGTYQINPQGVSLEIDETFNGYNYIRAHNSQQSIDITLTYTDKSEQEEINEIRATINGKEKETIVSTISYTLFRNISIRPGVLNIKGNGDFDKNVEFYLKKTPSDSTFKSLGTYQINPQGVSLEIDETFNGYNYIRAYNSQQSIDITYTYTIKPLQEEIENILNQYAENDASIPYNGMSLPRNPSELNILTIGNSFTANAYTYLREIISAAGLSEKVTLARTFFPGETLSGEVNKFDNKLAQYGFTVSENGGEWQDIYTQNSVPPYLDNLATIQYALDYKNWDIIVLQQGSTDSGLLDKYEQSLIPLMQRVKSYSKNTGAKIVFHLTWAMSAKGSGQSTLDLFGGTQQGMYLALQDVCTKLKHRFSIDIVIPSFLAFQNARNDSELSAYIEDLTIADGRHANNYGSYIAGGCYFNTIIGPCFNMGIKDNTYRNSIITESNYKKIQAAIVLANSFPNEIKELETLINWEL